MPCLHDAAGSVPPRSRRRVAARAVAAELDAGGARGGGRVGPRGDRPGRRLPGQPGRARQRAVSAAIRCPRCAGSPRCPARGTPYLLAGDGWAMACASPETLVRVVGGRVETLPIKGTRPATAAGRAELLSLGQGTRRAHHDRRPGAQRPRPGRPYRHASRCRSCSRCGAGATCGRPSRGWWPNSPTGWTWPRCCARCARAGRSPVRPSSPRWRRSPPWSRSVAGRAWARWAGSTTRRLDLGLTIRTVAVDGERVHLWAGGGITWDSDPDGRGGRGRRQGRPAPRRPGRLIHGPRPAAATQDSASDRVRRAG